MNTLASEPAILQPYLQVESLVKKFSGEGHDLAAVNGISFQVPKGRLFTLLGPSGCGKSTTLRCIAGLEKPEGGVISVNGQVQVNTAEKVFVPPHKRGIGMVFQSYAIWPHMTVEENIAFPLKARKFPQAEIKGRVARALVLLLRDSQKPEVYLQKFILKP